MHDAEADQGRQGWENLVVRTAPQFLFKVGTLFAIFAHIARAMLLEKILGKRSVIRIINERNSSYVITMIKTWVITMTATWVNTMKT